jgi:hypothetical protein
VTPATDEEVLAAAALVMSGPPTDTTSATGPSPSPSPGPSSSPSPGPSPGLDATVSTVADEVRFTFLKQRFIVENKFDGDKLLPKQRAFMTAMNILPVMASIDEKELVKVLENIVNNKNCRSDSWIGLSVKCGPIRTLLNTLADRLWVYLAKDPDILSRQARLATGAVGGPAGSVPGSLSPEGKSLPSGIPPGGHPFDPENDTIITIKLPLRSLYESAFGPSLLTMFEDSDAGKEIRTTRLRNIGSEASNATRNTRGDMRQANNQLINELYTVVNDELKPSSEQTPEQMTIDKMRENIIIMLMVLQSDTPNNINELKDHYSRTITAVLETTHSAGIASPELLNKVGKILATIVNFKFNPENEDKPFIDVLQSNTRSSTISGNKESSSLPSASSTISESKESSSSSSASSTLESPELIDTKARILYMIINIIYSGDDIDIATKQAILEKLREIKYITYNNIQEYKAKILAYIQKVFSSIPNKGTVSKKLHDISDILSPNYK